MLTVNFLVLFSSSFHFIQSHGPDACAPTNKHNLQLLGLAEKFHTLPAEEISTVRRGRGVKFVSDNGKCIRTSERGWGLTSNFLRGRGMIVF